MSVFNRTSAQHPTAHQWGAETDMCLRQSHILAATSDTGTDSQCFELESEQQAEMACEKARDQQNSLLERPMSVALRFSLANLCLLFKLPFCQLDSGAEYPGWATTVERQMGRQTGKLADTASKSAGCCKKGYQWHLATPEGPFKSYQDYIKIISNLKKDDRRFAMLTRSSTLGSLPLAMTVVTPACAASQAEATLASMPPRPTLDAPLNLKLSMMAGLKVWITLHAPACHKQLLRITLHAPACHKQLLWITLHAPGLFK